MKAGGPIDPFVKKHEVEQHPFSQAAFDTYLRWFLERTRVELINPAFKEDMLEEYIPPNQLENVAYNKEVREGRQTSFAPVLNSVVILYASSFSL